MEITGNLMDRNRSQGYDMSCPREKNPDSFVELSKRCPLLSLLWKGIGVRCKDVIPPPCPLYGIFLCIRLRNRCRGEYDAASTLIGGAVGFST